MLRRLAHEIKRRKKLHARLQEVKTARIAAEAEEGKQRRFVKDLAEQLKGIDKAANVVKSQLKVSPTKPIMEPPASDPQNAHASNHYSQLLLFPAPNFVFIPDAFLPSIVHLNSRPGFFCFVCLFLGLISFHLASVPAYPN